LNSAPSNPPNKKYLAIFCPLQFQSGPCSPKIGLIMGGQFELKKPFPGFQDTVSLIFLSKNLLFRILGSQGTKESHLLLEKQVCWKADFCLTTSWTLQPETPGCFFQPTFPNSCDKFKPLTPPTIALRGPPWGSWNCDGQKIC